jgi:outer membrane protein assembly factor BamB
MKIKSILGALFLLGGVAVSAQEEMSTIWEANVGHQMDYMYTGLEDKVSICADNKTVTAVNNQDGSIKWSKPYKEIAPKLRSINEMIPFFESNCLFVFDRKLGKDQIAVVDMSTGDFLWGTDQYQNVSESTVYYVPEKDAFAIVMTKGLVKKSTLVFIKAKTGEEIWETERLSGVIASTIKGEDGKYVLFNYAPTGLQFILNGFKNQVFKMDFDSGDIIWEAPYIGRFERKLLTKELIGGISIEEGKVFLTGSGIQAYDYKTGAQLWSAAYDYTPAKTIGGPGGSIKAWGVYGAVADPVIVGRDVYVLDMGNRKNQYLKKYDINSGRLLWTSPDIEGAKAIPNMYVMDDVVVLQIGGAVEIQYIQETKDSDGNITRRNVITTKNVKPTGVQAFQAADGKPMWDSERFKKGITNMMESNGNVIVCSGKALYKMDAKTGEELYEVDVKDDGIGLTELILPWKDQIIIVSDKGVSSHNVSDGALKNASKYKKSSMEALDENKLIMKTEKDDIACYNLNNIEYKEFNARKGAVSHLMGDGKYVYVYEKKTLTKLSTE